jgi:hypothetical protein
VSFALLAVLGFLISWNGIRSFEKLSGEGMTFVHIDLLLVLEEVLSHRFGETSSDCQVLECEGEHGILRLLLLVSSRGGLLDEEALRTTFLDSLAQRGWSEAEMARLWDRAGTVRVKRQWPMATKAGKILPLHLVPLADGTRLGSIDADA